MLTATTIYDSLPIQDIFRAVDDDTLLGVMDLRGMTRRSFSSFAESRHDVASFRRCLAVEKLAGLAEMVGKVFDRWRTRASSI